MPEAPSAAARLEAKAHQAGAPTTAVFQVTDRCMYECVHCYQQHGEKREPEESDAASASW